MGTKFIHKVKIMHCGGGETGDLSIYNYAIDNIFKNTDEVFGTAQKLGLLDSKVDSPKFIGHFILLRSLGSIHTFQHVTTKEVLVLEFKVKHEKRLK